MCWGWFTKTKQIVPNKYGWIPDIPDQRDLLYSKIAPPVTLPEKVDLRPTCSPVENQGDLGSCTANALAGNLEFLDKKPDAIYYDVSRLFIYYNERVLEHTVNSDAGARLRDGIKTLARQGYCSETIWPYDINKFAVKPTTDCYVEASQHRITSYLRLVSLNDMLNCLAQGFPFVFGFSVYESFESPIVAQTGVVNMPQPNERMIGGHAVMAVGYDQTQQRFIIRNSWGPNWGMQGYFTIPYQYLQTLANDFWTVRK